MSQADGRKLSDLTAFSLPFAGTTKLYGCATYPYPKCYPSRMPLKSATTSTTRANPAKGYNNATCPVAGEITIRQPQVFRKPGCAAMAVSPTSACVRSEEHTSELQSLRHLVCRLLLEKKK